MYTKNLNLYYKQHKFTVLTVLSWYVIYLSFSGFLIESEPFQYFFFFFFRVAVRLLFSIRTRTHMKLCFRQFWIKLNYSHLFRGSIKQRKFPLYCESFMISEIRYRLNQLLDHFCYCLPILREYYVQYVSR
mgnify:CR=1 FL=1